MSARLTRRDLFGQAMAAMATVPLIGQLPDTHELAYSVDLPADASLWGYVCFLGEKDIEIFVAGRNTTTISGRFDGKRLQEFQYANPKEIAQRVSITARRVGEDNLLGFAQFRDLGNGSPMVSFGVRPMPQEVDHRHGIYAYEAILTAYTVYP